MYKICKLCGVSKPLDQFHKKLDNKDKKSNKCKTCHSAAMHTNYLADKAAGISAARQRSYRAVTKAILDSFKLAGCLVCGEKEKSCLDAHHVDPAKKDMYFRNGLQCANVSPERLKRELQKCVCLCANCHRKLHAGIITIKGVICQN